MGFLKFLKKENKENFPEPPTHEMDEPPAPPSINGPGMPDIPDEIPLDSIHSEFDMEVPDFSPPPKFEQPSLPDFPEIKKENEKHPAEKEIINHMADEKSSFQPMIEHTQPITQVPTEHYAEEDPHTEVDAPIFIEAHNYQMMLGRLKSTRIELKKFEDKVFSLSEIRNKEEKKFALWKNKLEDIQRKLIYVDKALFEDR